MVLINVCKRLLGGGWRLFVLLSTRDNTDPPRRPPSHLKEFTSDKPWWLVENQKHCHGLFEDFCCIFKSVLQFYCSCKLQPLLIPLLPVVWWVTSCRPPIKFNQSHCYSWLISHTFSWWPSGVLASVHPHGFVGNIWSHLYLLPFVYSKWMSPTCMAQTML